MRDQYAEFAAEAFQSHVAQTSLNLLFYPLQRIGGLEEFFDPVRREIWVQEALDRTLAFVVIGVQLSRQHILGKSILQNVPRDFSIPRQLANPDEIQHPSKTLLQSILIRYLPRMMKATDEEIFLKVSVTRYFGIFRNIEYFVVTVSHDMNQDAKS